MSKNGNCSDNAVFTRGEPNPRLCSLCGCQEVAHIEQRPTGVGGTWQKWPYCEPCWQSCQSNGHNVEPEAWKVFIMFILQIDPRRHRSEEGEEIG